MRAFARVFLFASPTASGTLPSLAAPTGQAPGRGAQYDRFARLVYSPRTGRHQYDDREGAPVAAAPASISPWLALPGTTASALSPAASPVSPAASAATGDSLVVKPEWFRIASGQGIGLAGYSSMGSIGYRFMQGTRRSSICGFLQERMPAHIANATKTVRPRRKAHRPQGISRAGAARTLGAQGARDRDRLR
jgi:hypothetical protein